MNRPQVRTKHATIFVALVAVASIAGVAWSVFDIPAHARLWGGDWHDRHSGIARLCGDDRAALLDGMPAYGVDTLDITEAQEPAWQTFAATLHQSGQSFDTLCADLAEAGTPENAPQTLALAETAIAAGHAALRITRPAFDSLYAVLDNEQRSVIDGLLTQPMHR